MTPLIVDPAHEHRACRSSTRIPSEVGADRIVNAIAAYEQFGRSAGRPLIVCDFGTATTLDAVTAKGEYLGGAICPGRARFPPTRCFSARRGCRASTSASRRTVIGRTTVGAMESGLFYGYVGHGRRAGAPDERRARRQRDVRRDRRPRGVIAPETPLIDHVDLDLTLQGLRIVWERNQ